MQKRVKAITKVAIAEKIFFKFISKRNEQKERKMKNSIRSQKKNKLRGKKNLLIEN